MTAAGTTNPPRLGPSGPTMTGVSPETMIPPTGYAESWMLHGMQAGLAAVRPGEVDRRAGEADAGAVAAVVDGPVGGE